MRIGVYTVGTRGDVQPYVALGKGLAEAGRDVTVITHGLFEPLVRSAGLGIAPLQSNPRQVLRRQALSQVGSNPIRITGFLRDNLEPVMRQIFVETLEANVGSELMINSGLALAGWHVAEKLDTPAIAGFLWPMTPSRCQLGAIGRLPPSWIPFDGVYQYLATKLFNQLSLQPDEAGDEPLPA